MIDGFKLKVTDTSSIQHLFNHPQLDFKTEVSHHTGEISNIYRARYKGLRFEYINYPHRQTLFIRGSLPQYYTGLSNYTNLPLSKALQAVQALAQEFKLDIYTTAVLSLEWGLNIPLPQEISVNQLIRNILVYKGKQPAYHGYEHNGLMFTIDLNDFSIKIYNKSAQRQEESGDLVRYELRIKRKPQLQRLGIYALSDLFNKQCTDRLQKKLVETTDHLLFYDYNIAPAAIPVRSRALLLAYNNRVAWENLMHTNAELYRKKKKTFARGVTKASGVDWNRLLRQSIEGEAASLLATEAQPAVLQAL